eukprot:COSAG02_NODE_15993_length_1122_cov_1.609971_2_plen_140_part_00
MPEVVVGGTAAAGRHGQGQGRLLLLCCWLSVGCWGVLLFFGATRGLDLLKNCKWDMSSPKGSPSDTANALAQALLTQKGNKYELSQAALVTARAPATHPVTHPAVRELTQRLLVRYNYLHALAAPSQQATVAAFQMSDN